MSSSILPKAGRSYTQARWQADIKIPALHETGGVVTVTGDFAT
jgi:hypothetical protein